MKKTIACFEPCRLQRSEALKHGGPISWFLLAVSNYLIAWMGMTLWPIYFNGEKDIGIYIWATISMFVGHWIAYQSDRGFLAILSALFTGVTYLILDIEVPESYGGMFFLVVLLAGAVVVHYPK